MKTTRTILTTATLLAGFFLASNVQAQTVNAGAWMLGGSAGFTSTTVDGVDDASNVIFINPNIGYFIIDNLGVGVTVNFLNVSQGDVSSSGFGGGLFARYYVFQGLFPQVGFSYNTSSSDLSDEDSSWTDINIGVGYSFFLNNSVAVEPMLGYTITSGDFKENTFGLTIGVQGFLGRN